MLFLCSYMSLSQFSHSLLILVVMLFKAYVGGGSIVGSAISNLGDGMDVRSLCLSGRFGAAPVTS
jgi:hypothetical protein